MADNNLETVGIFTADVSQLTDSFNSLMQQISATREEMKLAKAGTAEYNALAQKLTQQEIKLAKAFKDNTVQIDKNSVSYRQLNDVLKDLKRTYKDVGTEQERNDITDGIKAFDDELKALDANIGNYQRNVGNYAGAMTNVSQVILQSVSDVGLLDKSTANLFIRLFRDIPKLTNNLNSLRNTTSATGKAAGTAASTAVKGLGSIATKLGVVAAAAGVAYGLFKMFQSEIERGARKVIDWVRNLVGLESETAKATKLQNDFIDALKNTSAQLAGQITTYKLLETLVARYALSTGNAERAASELLKILKLQDDAVHRAEITKALKESTSLIGPLEKKTYDYTNAITALTEALYEEAKANAVVDVMTSRVKDIIDLQTQLVDKEIEKRRELQRKEEGAIDGFMEYAEVALRLGVKWWQGYDKALEKTHDRTINNLDKDIDELKDKIKEKQQELVPEFEKLMKAVFPEGNGADTIMKAMFGDPDSNENKAWFSEAELRIKEIEALQEDYWKYSKAGYAMYMKMYDEIAEHYKADEKKYRETLANKKAFHKQYTDYIKKLRETDMDYGKGQYEKELNELERWKTEQTKIYKSAGLSTENLIKEYNNRREKIQKNYLDKYADLNKRYAKINESIAEQVEMTWTMIDNFAKFSTDFKRIDLMFVFDETATDELKDQVHEMANTLRTESADMVASLEKERDAEIQAAKDEFGTTSEYAAKRYEIIKKYEKLITDTIIDYNNRIVEEAENTYGVHSIMLEKTKDSYEKAFEVLYAESQNTFNAVKGLIQSESDLAVTELEKQRDNELIVLKERLGDTEEYKTQEASLREYYDHKIAETRKKYEDEITANLRNNVRRQMQYIDEYYEHVSSKQVNTIENNRVENERRDFNGGWGRIGQTTAQDSIQADIDKANAVFENFEAATKAKLESLNEILLNDTSLTVEERLAYEEEYFNLYNELEDEKLAHSVEINQLRLENEKQTQADILQATQATFSQTANLFDSLYKIYEADAAAKVKEGKMTQEEAEKELEKYRGIKAAAAAMDAIGSAVGAYNSMASIPYVGPVLGAIAAAAALAAGYANVRQILAVKKDGSGGQGTQYQQVTPVMMDYQPQIVQNATGEQETEQLANALAAQPIRAYVVESDITNAQQTAAQRNSESTF